jgi:3-dehydroquinate synthase
MIMAAELSDIPAADRARLRRLVAATGLPVEPPVVRAGALAEAMKLDKKVQQKTLRFVLLKALGDAFVTTDYSVRKLQEMLQAADR